MTELAKVIATEFPSTAQFRNVSKFLQRNVSHEAVVPYFGTVKLHGTNGSLIKYEDGRIYCMSKGRILNISHDNSGMCRHMEQFDLNPLFDAVEEQHINLFGEAPQYPIRISGEWAGKGIQKNVAISQVDKFFAIFSIRFGIEEDNGGRSIGWQHITNYSDIHLHEARIYNICEFHTFRVDIDVNMPALASNLLGEITEMVEKECPVGKFFGVEGVGEGVVWTPMWDHLVSNPQSWFKVKGQKHSVSKVKTLAPVDPEKLANIQKFVEYACTENRLNQGLQETGELDTANLGKFIGWVNKDIHKEEQDTLAANGLDMKNVGKMLATKSRQFYMAKLAEL